MKNVYKNVFLGQSRTEIRKEWDNCWAELSKLDPMKDYVEYVELNKQFDKCVEAYYAVDCGTYWQVQSASGINGKYMTYKVKKES